jgi:hypothetical protein
MYTGILDSGHKKFLASLLYSFVKKKAPDDNAHIIFRDRNVR